MADELKNYLKSDYVLVPRRDGDFGSKLPNGSWDGVIGEIKDGVSISIVFLWTKSRSAQIVTSVVYV